MAEQTRRVTMSEAPGRTEDFVMQIGVRKEIIRAAIEYSWTWHLKGTKKEHNHSGQSCSRLGFKAFFFVSSRPRIGHFDHKVFVVIEGNKLMGVFHEYLCSYE